MGNIKIQYRIELKGGRIEVFDLQLHPDSLELIGEPNQKLPDWTRLDCEKCCHCPLNSKLHSHCPVAVSLVDIIRRFENVVSFDEIHLEVITEERRILQMTTAQRGISSLLGLLIATCGCPHTAFLKPMARFHLPLASEESTIYRAAGMYLLAQYFLKQQGAEADLSLDGLKQIYRNIHEVNLGMAKRLSQATQTDSSINAIVLLDTLTNTLPFVIEEQLEEIRYLFAPYQSPFYSQVMQQAEESGTNECSPDAS